MRIKFFEDDILANDYQKEVEKRSLVDLIWNQPEWLYMVDELGRGRNPMLKENAVEYIQETVIKNMGWFIADMVAGLIEKLAAEDIDLSEGVAEWYNEYYGYEPDDDEYVVGKVDPEKECG